MNESRENPLLIMMRGLPGSGKSYLAHSIGKRIGSDKVVILDPDEIDYEDEKYLELSNNLSKDGVDIKLHPYRFLRARAYEAIKSHQIIIWNQAFTHLDLFKRTIINLESYAQEQGLKLPYIVVEVNIDKQIAIDRLAQRKKQGGHVVSNDAFARFVRDYSSFSSQGVNVLSIDGDNDIKTSVKTIINEIKKFQNN